MNRRLIWGSLAVLVCVAGVLFGLRSWGHVTEPAAKANDDGAAALRDLRQQVDELKQLRAADLLVAAHAATPERGPSAAARGHAEPPPIPEAVPQAEPAIAEAEAEQEAARAEAAIVATIDRSFASEVSDPRWSGTATNQVVHAVSGSLPKGSLLGEVSCRSSICKIETTHESLEAFQSFNDAAFVKGAQSLWNGAVYSAVNEQSAQGIRAVSYLAKEGQTLPMDAPAE